MELAHENANRKGNLVTERYKLDQKVSHATYKRTRATLMW